jgi:hypothetical protein
MIASEIVSITAGTGVVIESTTISTPKAIGSMIG